MNFVIFSYHFLPLADAEAFCTTRFASALAESGHDVQVVTMDWPSGVSAKVYDFLVDKRIRIVRVPLKQSMRGPVWSRLRYLTHEWNAVNIARCIETLRGVLMHTKEPVLISRTFPLASLIVAWHCRSFARKWIAHLSDPIPWFVTTKAKSTLESFWARRALRHATAISLTCDLARRFYHDQYGSLFDDANVIIVPHVGDPPLTQLVAECSGRTCDSRSIVHTGLLYPGRGAREIIATMRRLNSKGLSCRFVQVGEIDPPIKAEVEGSPCVDVINSCDPALASKAQQDADVAFVPDLITHLPYSPFCASKFAYQVFGDKPIVMLSRHESLMSVCARRFPAAGLFFADADRPESLDGAVEDAIGNAGRQFEREGLRSLFSRKRIVTEFVGNVGAL